MSPIRQSLLLAAGILASTGIAVSMSELGWWVMLAPGVMSLAVAAAATMAKRTGDRASTVGGLIMAASLLLAGVILTASDPGAVPESMPLLGVAAATPFLLRRRRSG